MKKIVRIVLCMFVCLSLTACSDSSSDSDKVKETSEESVLDEVGEPTASPEEVVEALKGVAEEIVSGSNPMTYIDESRFWTDVSNYESMEQALVISLIDISEKRKKNGQDDMTDMKYTVTMTAEGVQILKDGQEITNEDEMMLELAEILGNDFSDYMNKKSKDLPDYVLDTDCSGSDMYQWVKKTVDPRSFREGEDTAESNASENNITESNTEEDDMTDKNSFAAGITGDNTDDGNNLDETLITDSGINVSDIETECPASAIEKREGTEYSDFIHFTYYSNTCGMDRNANILLPAGYTTDKKYPVVYMLHGIFGDENSFKNDNNMKTIWTNMASDGAAPEMIVVFPDMYAKTEPGQAPAFTAEACLPYDNFVNDLVNDLMPYVEANYSILTGRENTAVAGFSMGGRETLYISLLHPELFGYSCAISPAPGLVPGKDMFMSHPGSMTEEEVRYEEGTVQPQILILCGTKDSVVGTFPKEYHELLEKNGVEHTWYEVPGADHDNRAIMSGIYNFLHRVFKK